MSALLPAACQHVSDRHGKFRFQILHCQRRQTGSKKDESGGGYALCHLPDSMIVEEWEYFRSQH